MERVRIGVVGLGAIAQAIHLPNLARLWDRFEIVHVCDLDGGLAGEIAMSLGPSVRHADEPRQVVDDPDVEAILILSSGPHAPLTRSVLDAGKHVFVEKPLCLAQAEAKEIDDAARSVERVLQVGYMKIHDPIVPQAVADVRSMSDPRLLRITVLHPTEASQQRHLSIRRSVVSDAAIEASRAYQAEMTRSAIGDLPPWFGAFYRDVALGSMIHQVAMARHLIGHLPHDVFFADAWPFDTAQVTETSSDPPTVVAMGEFAPGFRMELDWLWLASHPDYVERYDLFGSNTRLSLEMPTPYLQDQPAALRVVRSMGSDRVSSHTVGACRSGFQAELEAFHDAIVAGPPYPSDAADARDDTRFLQRLVGHLAERIGFSSGGESAMP